MKIQISVLNILIIRIFFLKLVISDVSHLSHNEFFRHHYQSLYEQSQHNKPIFGPPPSIKTTTEFILPEIIVNKKTKNNNGYDYNRPTKPPLNIYVPPASDQPVLPIDNPVQQFPDENQQPEVANESFSGFPPLIELDNTPTQVSQGYIPPVSYERGKHKKIANSDIIVTYDKDFGGYDYKFPTEKPFPIFIPTPAVGADIPVTDGNSSQITPEEIPIQGYNYEVPTSQGIPSSTSIPDRIYDPQSGYLPPIPSSILIRHAKDFAEFNVNAKNPIKLHLIEMKCLNSQGGYFKTVLRLDSLIGLVPIVDNDISDSGCDLRLVQSNLIVNIAAKDFSRCGVRYCDNNLCLRIRFPLIRGMKSGVDSLLTLRCKIQEKVIAKTHSLKMGVDNEVQGRSIGALALGGNQQPFKTYIELLRKSPNGFTKPLEFRGAVQLGEEILLRAHVNAGDGWNYTKLTDINLQRLSPSGEILNSANLITSDGCINPTMRSICPMQPSFDPPLGHRLSFKVIMFQGMHSGEEIVVSMKITGCIERVDCNINTQYCNNPFGRLKRSLEQNNKNVENSTEFQQISTVSFRVIVPEDDNRKFLYKRIAKNKLVDLDQSQLLFLIFGSIGIVCFIVFFIALIYLKLK